MNLLPSVEYLYECFRYDRENGLLVWKVRPVSHFKPSRYKSSEKKAIACNMRCAGHVAGCLNKKAGEVYIGLDGYKYTRSELIYKIENWTEASGCIFHVNGDRSDDRVQNLSKDGIGCVQFA